MHKINTKLLDNTLFDKQYILSDFIPEFDEYCGNRSNFRFSCDTSDELLYKSIKNGKIHFSTKHVHCPRCKSHKIVKNGYYERELIFLDIGQVTCTIQKYKCKICGKIFYTDLSSIVNPNSNITVPVIKIIEDLYSIHGSSIHKIQYTLKKHHNVNISYQSIENILLNSKYDIKHENWSLSGYYIFDALWVKKNGKWHYLLALFDIKLNTIVSIKLVESENLETIQDFLAKSLANQDKKCIVTDLKKEYRQAIDKLKINHQFCKFHTKQLINRQIKDHIRKNKTLDEEIEIINDYKKDFYRLIDAETLEIAKEKRNELYKINKNDPPIIHKLAWDLIIPEFNRITYHIKDKKTPTTSNKIENSFLKNFPKHIKKNYKTVKGIIKRFWLKLKYWNIKNEKTQNHQSF